MDRRCSASQTHTAGVSSSSPPPLSASSPGLLSPCRCPPTGWGWRVGQRRTRGPGAGALCRRGRRLLGPGTAGLLRGSAGPPPLCAPPPVSHPLPPHWKTGPTSFNGDYSCCKGKTAKVEKKMPMSFSVSHGQGDPEGAGLMTLVLFRKKKKKKKEKEKKLPSDQFQSQQGNQSGRESSRLRDFRSFQVCVCQ